MTIWEEHQPLVTWINPPTIPIPPGLQQALGEHPLLLQALVQRGLSDPAAARAFLDPQAYTPVPPAELPGLSAIADRLERAIHSSQTIAVWGDFDVDGQTATTILVEGLRGLGAKVIYHIPLREHESHGVNVPGLQQLAQAGADLFLTCDTGISAHEAAQWARTQDLDFLITDHHDPPPELPPASAITNPKFLPADHPLASLPGAGVAFKLIEELYHRAGRMDELPAFYDLAALGIIADVAALRGETRFLAQRGIKALRETRRMGLRLLFTNAEINPQMLTEEHISFGIAPRLNAVGRLGDANPMVEFLTTQDEQLARQLAFQIEGYNEQRKRLTEDVFQGALYQLEHNRSLLDEAVLVLYHPDWHPGVLGIVASRLVERFGKPAILLSGKAEQGARGSARSIEGIHITQAIAAQAEMLGGFGGHPMAAGLSIPPAADLSDQIGRFRKALSYTIQNQEDLPSLEPRLEISAYLPLNQVDWELAFALEKLAPFGAGNPPPVFAAQDIRLQFATPIGRLGEHLLMTVEDEQDNTYRLIWWQGAGWPLPQGVFDLAYRLRASSYNGEAQIQFEWVDFRQSSDATALSAITALSIHDYRRCADPLRQLEELRLEHPSLQVWAEAAERMRVQGQDRAELQPAEALVIWSIPPGYSELRKAVERVSPRLIYLFAVDPQTDDPQQFLERLQGLLKSLIQRRAGQTEWVWLAAATAQREICVKLGLEWLASGGWITFQEQNAHKLLVAKGAGNKQPPNEELYRQLCRHLSESAAYRTFYRESALEALRAQMELK